MAISTDLLAKIKTSLRINHSALDTDVADTISACLADLRVCGILPDVADEEAEELSPLILTAVKLYCKTEYTDEPAKAARYNEGYNNLKSCLMMAEGYAYKEAVKDE